MYMRHDSYIDASIYPGELANHKWYTVSGIAMSITVLYWAHSHGERGGGTKSLWDDTSPGELAYRRWHTVSGIAMSVTILY